LRGATHPTLVPYTTLFRSFPENGFYRIRQLFPAQNKNEKGKNHIKSRRKRNQSRGRFADPLPAAADHQPCSQTEKNRCRCGGNRSEEHTSELQSRFDLVCR